MLSQMQSRSLKFRVLRRRKIVHFRPVITRWSGSTSRMRVIGEARNANLLSRTRLIAVSVVYWWVGNLYDVCIGLTELGGLSQSPCKIE